jgi:hypothetical protein
MLMRLTMPWFLPVAAAISSYGTHMARDLYRREGKRGFDGPLMLLLAWTPLFFWLLIQFTASQWRQS